MIKVKKKHELQTLIDKFPVSKYFGPIIAGGSVRAMVQNKPITTDVDIYFTSQKQLDWFKSYLIAKYANGQDVFRKTQFTYSVKMFGYDLQLMHFKFFNSVDQLFQSFDFTVCQYALTGGDLYMTEEAVRDTKDNIVLFTKNSKYNRTFYRIKKYKDKGFYVPLHTYALALWSETFYRDNRLEYR
jgi:hypothetical protein